MHFSTPVVLLLSSAGLLEAAVAGKRQPGSLLPRQNKAATQTCLAANALQTASTKTGQEAGSNGLAAGQSKSAVDSANFINFCQGQTLTNGQQNTAGSCNGIPMGKIPAKGKMIASIITNPQPGDNVQADTTFDVSVQIQNLAAGVFTNPQTTYYNAPQDLDGSGNIIGHAHITIQSLGTSLKTTTVPDPTKFAFFKGIDDAGNGQGLLKATVTNGLPAGFYRVCTLIGSANHQPVIMPVAQRGAQDDCTKFQVVAGGGNNNGGAAAAGNAGNAGKGNGNANAGAAAGAAAGANAGNAGKGGNAGGGGAAANTGAAAGAANAGNAGNAGKGGNAGAAANAGNAGKAGAGNANAGAAAGNAGKAGNGNASAGAAASANAGAAANAGNAGKTGNGNATAGAAAGGSTGNAGNTGNNAGAAAAGGAAAGAANIPTIKSGSLGGAAPAVTFSGDNSRPFSVNGNTFVNAAAAIQRACDIQFNQCANQANSGQLQGKTVGDCATQKTGCGAA